MVGISLPRHGMTLLILVGSLILLSISLSVVLPRATHDVRRAKEDDLRFILGEYRRSVEKFRARHNRNPQDFGELLRDGNGEVFLRRIYVDPFTKKTDWVFSVSGNEPLIHSNSSETSLAGVPYRDFR